MLVTLKSQRVNREANHPTGVLFFSDNVGSQSTLSLPGRAIKEELLHKIPVRFQAGRGCEKIRVDYYSYKKDKVYLVER